MADQQSPMTERISEGGKQSATHLQICAKRSWELNGGMELLEEWKVGMTAKARGGKR